MRTILNKGAKSNRPEEQQARRAARLPIRQREIEALAEQGFEIKRLTEWQYRVNNCLDLYPIHNRWHDIKKNRRGGAKNLAEFTKHYFSK